MASADQLGFTFQPVGRRIWTVRDLVAAVRTHIEREYSDIWVEGEISNFRRHDSGHLYFTLKDEGSQLSAVMFRSQARLLRFRPENGMHVVVRGRTTIYEERGQLQLSAEYIEPKGAGALQIAFEQLKARLQAEGLFDSARKKPLPVLPHCIGIVTSPQAAVLRDILNVLGRRHNNVSVLIFPAQVQGEAAAREVCAGIRHFNRSGAVDVVIVARGGGPAEDLAAFNDEALARTVAESAVPIISAVGHETDFTIIDFVADLRAPTPSAAAELVIRSRQELEDQLQGLHRRLEKAVRYRLIVARKELTELVQHGAFARTMDLVHRRQQRSDDLAHRLAHAERRLLDANRRRLEALSSAVRHHDVRHMLASTRARLDTRTASMVSAVRAALQHHQARASQLSAKLGALSPVAILERGYALVFDSAGNLLKNAADVKSGDEISARLAQGGLQATVTAKSE